jgi:putative membrane protein
VSISQWSFSVDTIVSLLIVFGVLGFLFWVINSPVKKILSILTIPVNVLTLGLFSLLLNVLVFYLFQYIANTYIVGVTVDL